MPRATSTPDLATRAAAVLAANDRGGWTRPAPHLYPHQWLWDSCFTAIGLSHINPARAAAELQSLLRGQWSNGMFPHMILSQRFPYRLERLLWGSHKLAPKGIYTSGITQPPILAIAAEQVAGVLSGKQRDEFLGMMLPAITRFHEWLYRERDPHHTGLPVCLHSWESGMDDTPAWTEVMRDVPGLPWYFYWLREYRVVNPTERARAQDVRTMAALSHILKKHNYDSRKLLEVSPVAMQDVSFGSILAAANESLERLAKTAGQSLSGDLRNSFAATRRALEGLWDKNDQQYYNRNLRTGHLQRVPAISGLMPLFAGTATPERAEHLRRLIASDPGYTTRYVIPSVPTTSAHFEPRRYWDGPVWINMNWFIIRGLRRYGFDAEAERVRQATFELVEKSGWREYFDPYSGDGLGAHEFSWTAALTLDLLVK